MRLPAIALLTLGLVGVPAAAAASEASVVILAPEEGAVVSGVVAVTASTEGGIASVSFEWASSADGPWTNIETDTAGSDGWTASWDTSGHDGPAVVRASASDGATEASDLVSVTVDNAPEVTVDAGPNPFSPNGDGIRDSATLRASSDTAGTLGILVIGPAGAERRSWHTEVQPGEIFEVQWEGKADGEILADATYTIRAEMGGSSAEVPLTLDTNPPSFAWREVSPEPLTDQDFVNFKFTTFDRASKIQVTLKVRDRVRQIGSDAREVSPGDRQITWKAAYPAGGKLFPGLYTARLVLKDDAGNVRVSGWKPWRVKRSLPTHVYTQLQGTGPRVSLTFDDCNFADAWRRILNVLAVHDVEATFFCTGQAMLAHPGLVRRTVKEGHTLGSHGWDHALLPGHSVSYTAGRLAKDAKTTWQLAKTTTWPYFRPPYGAYDGNVRVAATQTSHPRIVLWDVDPLDWQRPGASLIASRVVKGAHKGSIILLHVIGQTASALPAILKGLKAKGLTAVDLPNLFRAAGMH